MKKKNVKKEKYDEKKIINTITPQFSRYIWKFQKDFNIKTHIFPTMCNPITRTSLVPQDHPLPFAHVHLSNKCVFSSFPSVEYYFSMTFLTSLGK
jgi:hypothetical protein